MSIGPGSEVGDRYELGHQLGSGGMATVYLAYDTVLDREVDLEDAAALAVPLRERLGLDF